MSDRSILRHFGLSAKSIYPFGLSFPLLIACSCGVQARAQNPAPDQIPVQTADPDHPTYKLETAVRRVLVDVVVTDSKGHAVKGLSDDDFQVFEDGKPQTKRGFDVHDLARSAAATKPPLPLALPPNTFVNLVRAPDDLPVTVLLYDVLNTPLTAMPYAHDAMVRFIKSQKSSSRIAIFVLGDRLRMLQGFTDDETRLLAAINSKAARTQQSGALQNDYAASTALSAITADDAALGATTILGELKSLEATEQTMLLQQRLELTVNAFAQIARFVSALPGRKNLIWMSGSFPSAVLPDSDPTSGGTANEFGDAYSLGNEVKEAEDLLNLAHVAVYPVDVRGLQVNPQFTVAGKGQPGPSKIDPFYAQNAAELSTMDEVADSTGGHAFYNTNGLEQAMQSAIDNGSSYYTLTYAPSNAKQDGSLRHIKVTLSRQGYQLSYRRTYYADAGAHPAAFAKADVTPGTHLFMTAAMQHGAPISPELFFEVDVEPVGGVMVATPAEMKALTEFLAVKTKHGAPISPTPLNVQHYEVSYAVLGRQLSLPPADDGRYSTDMTFGMAAFSPDSELVNGTEVSVKNKIPAAQYQKIKTQGYHASMVFPVPVNATSLRLAVRDGLGDRTGSLEIPLPVKAKPAPGADAPKPE